MMTTLLRRLVGPYGLIKDIIQKKASIHDLLRPLTRPEMTSDWRELINRVSESRSLYSAIFDIATGWPSSFPVSINNVKVSGFVACNRLLEHTYPGKANVVAGS